MKTRRHAKLSLLVFAVLLFWGCNSGANKNSSSTSSTDVLSRPLKLKRIESPSGLNSREPELSLTPDGRIIMSWVERVTEKRARLRFALREGMSWSEPRTISEGDNWFVNWADFPSVIGLRDGSLAAHWLVKSGPGTYAYDVNISLSNDNGVTWTKPITPHTDKTQTEHGFVSLLPLSDGRLGAVWVDGRALHGMKMDEDHGPLAMSMALRYAAIDSMGKLSDEAVLDDRICECCQTSGAMTSDGPIAAYRDRSDREIRDIYVVRQVNGKWNAPQLVSPDGWEIKGCPVNGPSIAAEGQKAAIAWYTESNNNPRVQIAFSNDAGRSFGNTVQVDDGSPVGRVDVLLLADGSALVCWMSGNEEKGATKVRRVSAEGTLDAISTVTETNISRSSGFPRIARIGNDVLFAWTEFGRPSRVSTAVTTLAQVK